MLGIQSASLHDGEAEATIATIANKYLAEIEEAYGFLPSAIIGWSMGGLIAFEMSRQLRDRGKDRALTILIDTHPPQSGKTSAAEILPPYVRFAADLARMHIPEWRRVTEDFLSASPDKQPNILRDALLRQGMLLEETADDDLRSLFSVYARNTAAAECYRPKPTDHPLILMTTGSNARQLSTFWSQLAPIAAAHSIETDHYGLMRLQNVHVIAGHLQGHLDTVGPRKSPSDGAEVNDAAQ
jgi:thioesterase domain-containing protein